MAVGALAMVPMTVTSTLLAAPILIAALGASPSSWATPCFPPNIATGKPLPWKSGAASGALVVEARIQNT